MVEDFTPFLARTMTKLTLLYMFFIILFQYYLTAGANCISSLYLGVSISSCFIFAVMQCAFTGGIFGCGGGGGGWLIPYCGLCITCLGSVNLGSQYKATDKAIYWRKWDLCAVHLLVF